MTYVFDYTPSTSRYDYIDASNTTIYILLTQHKCTPNANKLFQSCAFILTVKGILYT